MTSTQIDPSRSPRAALPTMYDLPSERVGEPGLPDEFHSLQPQLLGRSLALTDYTRDEWFAGSDLNLYYDVRHPLWYKRPDWFLAVGVPRLYERRELRRSYVVWQERQNPRVAIEFLSPGTEAEDLGRFHSAGVGETSPQGNRTSSADPKDAEPERPPSKCVVYEENLQVPHYIVYNRLTQELRYFQLAGAGEDPPQDNRYREQTIQKRNPKIWLSDLQVGLGIWEGTFEGARDRWLRWCDGEGNWLSTDTERAEARADLAEVEKVREKERADLAEAEKKQEKERADRLAAKLRALGIDPEEV